MKYLNILGLLLTTFSAWCQNKSDLPFIEHLINKGFHEEAIYRIGQSPIPKTEGERDSLSYFKGWAEYSLKNLQESTNSLLKVGETSNFYLKSQFFAGYNQIFLGSYVQAKQIFNQINAVNDPNLSLVKLELSGIEMLNGNWQKADVILQEINPEIATLNEQVVALSQICKIQSTRRAKSPLLAGIMSGVIPGSGKIYAGKTGEGIASFISNTGFGLITWENSRKLGFDHPKTILFGCIFMANYISNIYGSVISVKITENEYKNATHNQILFQLHIPLRNLFE